MSAPVRLIIENFLTQEERTSAVWRSVEKHLERMLAKKRIENDSPNLTTVETATLRGHIALLTAMLALGKTPPAMTASPGSARPREDLGAKYG